MTPEAQWEANERRNRENARPGAGLSPENEAFLRREHPDVLAAREGPHAPEPMSQTPAEAADHVCRGGCVCARCWEPFSAPIHRKAARR